jgi:SAM-dependent methyltransferase
MKIGWRRRLWYAFIRARVPFKRPLVKTYLRVLERKRSLHSEPRSAEAIEGVPVPPARLRVLVNGIPDVGWFLASGKAQTDYLRTCVADADRPLDQMAAILEFGCGCGRMTRWWAADAARTQIYACDYNDELVRWCQANLPFVTATTNALEPPLPYRDGSFDFVYAFSVFTHLSVDLAKRWLSELRRVTKPGALIWFTVHGQTYRERLPSEQRRQFDAGEVVVWFPEIEGTNLCAAYWPDASVPAMLGDAFEVLEHLDPQTDPLSAQVAQIAPHDAYLIRRV